MLTEEIGKLIGHATSDVLHEVNKKIDGFGKLIKPKEPEPRNFRPSSIPSPFSSSEFPPLPSRPKMLRKKKSPYLEKPKILYVGDSIAQNANIAQIEKVTKTRIKTQRAYSSINDSKWPQTNFIDTTPAALANTQEDDDFSYLVLSAPTVDISNMDTTKLTNNDNVEAYKQKIAISCENMFSVAECALAKNENLKTVVLMEHAPRYDIPHNDPTGLKPELVKFANNHYQQLLQNSSIKKNILIGKHSLGCPPDMISAHYQDDRSGRFDGVHLYGSKGKEAYTESVTKIFHSMLSPSAISSSSTTSSHISSSHTNCPQARYQRRQAQKQQLFNNYCSKNYYNVPVSNQYDVLGN